MESFFQPRQKQKQELSHLQDSNQGGASRLSIALGSTLSLNDDVVIIVKTLKLIMRNGIGEPISTKFKTKLRAFTFTGI